MGDHAPASTSTNPAPSPGGRGSEDTFENNLRDSRLTLTGLFHESWTGLETHVEGRMREVSDLPMQWFILLLRLARSPGRRLRLTDLAGQSGLSPSGLTRALDKIEEAGLAQRVACPDDRRTTWATITEQGVEQLAPALDAHLTHLDEAVYNTLSPEEQTDLARLLRKIRDHVNPAAARPPSPITD